MFVLEQILATYLVLGYTAIIFLRWRMWENKRHLKQFITLFFAFALLGSCVVVIKSVIYKDFIAVFLDSLVLLLVVASAVPYVINRNESD